VSRALAGDPRISVATRRAVEQIARRLGYAPNALARGLAGRGADVVAVVIPRSAEYTFTSPFHLAGLKGISRVLQEAGQLLLLSFLEERDYVALHRSGLCRGVIVLMCRIGDRQVAALARRRVPAVLIPGDPGLPGIGSVNFDVAAPTALAMRRLLDLGHRRIGFIGGAPDSLFHRDRLAAFEGGLAEAGVAADPQLVAETNFTPTEGAERAMALLGGTVDGGRIWDTMTVIRRRRSNGTAWCVAGRDQAGIIAAYAALYEPSIEKVVAVNPPASHGPSPDGGVYGPVLLHVLRVCDIPEALGCLAPRPLALIGARGPAFNRTATLYRLAGAADRLEQKPA